MARDWFDAKAHSIDHAAIIKNLSDTELSAGYLLVLTIANLIALCGLLTDSSAVIIGAMLISPLMGPILSFGFAFTTGDKIIWRKSTIKLIVSVAVTIAVAAIAAYISPLQESTSQIVARIRPNPYDLAIAFLSGLVGAAAICTRKNYLTIVPGVAIATAVIPPLSVTGYGLAILDIRVAGGAFLLFFTNFVSLVISTCIVFYFYGFRPKIMTADESTMMRRRMIFLASTLFLISIPLIYTLKVTVSDLALRREIRSVLSAGLGDRENIKIVSLKYSTREKHKIRIDAVAYTTSYIKDSELEKIKNSLTNSLKRDVSLHLDQIRVQREALKKESQISVPSAPMPPPPTRTEIITDSREKVLTSVSESMDRMRYYLSPWPVENISFGFAQDMPGLMVGFTVRKDKHLSEEEIVLLRKALSSDLGVPLQLKIETARIVPPLVFERRVVSLSEEMKNDLVFLKPIFAKDNRITILIDAYPESVVPRRKGTELAEDRAREVASFLNRDCLIPHSNMKIVIHRRKTERTPTIQVSTLSPEGK